MYADLGAVIAPIFISAAIGFVWGRQGRPFDAEFAAALVTFVGTPCLVGATLMDLAIDFRAIASVAGAALLAYAGFAVIGIAALRSAGLPFHSYLPALMFPNIGNMGLPVCLFAFGETGLGLAIVFFAIGSVLQFTVGVGIAAGSLAPGRLLRLPLVYAIAISLVFMVTDTPVPTWLANTLDLLGGVTIPLMLIALGVSLARLRARNLWRSFALSLVRLVAGLAVGLAIAWMLGLTGVARGVVILQCAMPVAVLNYLFAQFYRRAPEDVAGMVVISTALSFATLPLLLILVL